MIAQLTVISACRPAAEFVLSNKLSYMVGRSADNDVVIPEPSVSRQHAELLYEQDLWLLADLNSLNGIRYNGAVQQRCLLSNNCVVLVGNVPVKFEQISQEQLLHSQHYNDWRLKQTQQYVKAPNSAARIELESVMAEALKLCQMQRAAIILGNDLTSATVHRSLGVSSKELQSGDFFGSLGALQQVFSSQEAVVANDISQHQALVSRASTRIKQISAVTCLPLMQGKQIVGVFYVDSQQASKYLSVFDLELLQVLLGNFTAMLFSQQLDQQLNDITINYQKYN